VGFTRPVRVEESTNPINAVEKDHTTGAAIILPERSFTPLSVAVNVVEPCRLAAGVRTAVHVEESYEVLEAMMLLLESFKTNEIDPA
jgi:hypothetical protein